MRINAVSGNFTPKAKDLHFDRAVYSTGYNDIIKKCVCLFKYKGKTRLSRHLGEIMSNFALKSRDVMEADLIVPVPLHPVRLRQRQFNQSELLALQISKIINKKVVKDKLKRVRYTAPQTELTGQQRIKNVKEVFAVKNYAGFKDKTVVLVDDVITTGATFSECAKALKKAGARKIVAFALAKSD
ncbi:MAG: ComF family protein [Candidatus Omnitrophota bacterium]